MRFFLNVFNMFTAMGCCEIIIFIPKWMLYRFCHCGHPLINALHGFYVLL